MTVPGLSQWKRPVAGVALLALILAAGMNAQAAPVGKQGEPPTAKLIRFEVSLAPADMFDDRNAAGAPLQVVQPGEIITLTITGIPKEGYNTYPLTVRTKDQNDLGICSLKYAASEDFKPIYPVLESPAEFVAIPDLKVVYLEHKKPFSWTQDILVSPKAKLGKTSLRFSIRLQVCNEATCTPGQHHFDIPLSIEQPLPPLASRVASMVGSLAGRDYLGALIEAQPDTPVAQLPPPPPAEIAPARFKPIPPTEVPIPAEFGPAPPPPGRDIAKGQPDKGEPKKAATPAPTGDEGLLAFLVAAVGFGAISLLTPCVFPMIPITVSLFLEQGEHGSHHVQPGKTGSESPPEPKPHSPLLLALVYSGTIVGVLTISGVLFIPIIAPFSQHWITNLVLGGLFVVFSLSLFGMFEIVLPTWLADMTYSRHGQGGIAGTFFMALTFTIISFTCVAPFFGGFIALTAAASSLSAWIKIVLGALVYSITFASPFFLLALFPSWLKSLPKSGAWMNTLKVVMGFLELAAAFSFLRAAELTLFGTTTLLTYDLVLAIYVALSILCGLYLLNYIHLPHDHGKPENIGVIQFLFSAAFITLGLYLAPGLFTNDPDILRSRGVVFSWVDAFLLPTDRVSKPAAAAGAVAAAAETWTGSLDEALKEAREKKQRVFVDFTGINCKNCSLNERNVFPRPEIKELLGKFVLVKLYTDKIPPQFESAKRTPEENTALRNQLGSIQLPYYVILQPTRDGYEKVASYDIEGAVTASQFAAFLRNNL